MTTKKPRLMTPDLEKYIEKVHLRTQAEAASRLRVEAALREAWSTQGGRAFRRFIDTRPAPATQRIYHQHLEDYLLWLIRECQGIDPLDATPEDLASYERDVTDRKSKRSGKRLALRTRQERIRTIRTAYQFCADEDLIVRSPARHLRVRGRAEPRRTFLEDSEAAALVRACSGKRLSDVRDRTLIVVLLHTGLRAAEAAGLMWGSLDESDVPSITVEGKGRVVRTVPLSQEAHRAILEWGDVSDLRRHAQDPIWTRLNHRVDGEASRSLRTGTWTVTEQPLTPDGIHSIVTRRAERAGIQKRVTPHTLRRTFATKLKNLGVSIDSIGRYLGHASILTTVGYFNPHDEGASQTVRRMRYEAPAE